MGKLSRLIGLASQALDKDGGRQQSNGRPGTGSTDWGGTARSAVDAVRGTSNAPAPSAPQPPSSRATPAPNTRHAQSDGYAPPPAPGATATARISDADRAAIARYDYLLQTADPHRLEQIHREAFDRLSPQQRAHVEERMRAELPPEERPASASSAHLARAAGRAEAMRPGRMRRLLAGARGGATGGAGVAAGGAALGVLGAVAGGAVLSSVAAPLLEQAAGLGVDFESIAQGVDMEAITGGADEFLSAGGEAVSGLGETASGWGERLGDLGIPGIGDLFGR